MGGYWAGRAARPRARMRTRCPLLMVLIFLALALSADPAGAAPGDDEGQVGGELEALGLQVTIGHGGQVTSASWLPVEVALEPRRPVGGTLELEVTGTAGGPVTISRQIEVAAGSRSVYRFLMPTADSTVRVQIDEPGREPVAVRPERPRFADGFLIGGLGAVPSPAPPLRAEAVAESGTWVPVDAAWIALSSKALEPLGGLVAALSDLEALPAESLRNLASAVVEGLDLVVVADRDGTIDPAALGLPAGTTVTASTEDLGTAGDGQDRVRTLEPEGPAWTLSAGEVLDGETAAVMAAAVGAGRGRLVIVGTAPGQGALGASPALWSRIVGPRAGGAASDWDVGRNSYQFPRLLAGPEPGPPTIPWLSAFIITYVLVVGPVNGIVLARLRRRELAWVTVPLVTAVFTAATFLGAVGGRPPLGATARLAYWVDGVGVEATVIGLRNPTAGVREATLDGRGWVLWPVAEGAEGARITGGEQARAELHLGPLQFGGVIGTRATEGEPPLEIEAVAGTEGVEVTVTNRSGEPLHDVAVRAATSTRVVGDLEPGAGQIVTLGRARLSPTDPYRDLFFGLDDPASGVATPPGSLEALLRADLMDGNPGIVWVVAERDHASSPPPSGRGDVVDRGTLYAVGVTVDLPEGAEVVPHAVQRALLGSGDWLPSPLAVEGPDDAVLRFRFPAAGRVDRVNADLPITRDEGIQLRVWDHQARQWLPLEDAFGPQGGDPARLLSPLGELYVRAWGNGLFDFSGASMSGVAG